MANAELLDEFEDREEELMQILLQANIDRSTITLNQFIESRLLQGATEESIRLSLLDDLDTGGQIFGEFRNAIKTTARGSVNRVRDGAMVSEFGIERQFRWSAVLANTCADCLGNHGLVKTWVQWEQSAFGLPRSGGTICRQNCHCVLLPAESTELQPIIRGRK